MNRPEYTAADIQVVNLAQSICSRPRMYTPTGSLAEVIAFLLGHVSASWGRKAVVDPSIERTVEWLTANCEQPMNLLDDLLAKYATEQHALDAIGAFAASLNNR